MVNISSNAEAIEKEVSAHSIKNTKTIFNPVKELTKILTNLEFEKSQQIPLRLVSKNMLMSWSKHKYILLKT